MLTGRTAPQESRGAVAMRTVLIALVVGLVGQGMAVAGPGPGDPPPPQICPIGATGYCDAQFGCGELWPYEMQVTAPLRYGHRCVEGVCETYLEGTGGFSIIDLPYDSPDPNLCYAASIHVEIRYDGGGTLQHCGLFGPECCVG